MFDIQGLDGAPDQPLLSMKVLPFSKEELMHMLSEFLSQHGIARKQMSRRHVALFKAAVQHVGSERLSLVNRHNSAFDNADTGCPVSAGTVRTLHGNVVAENKQ